MHELSEKKTDEALVELAKAGDKQATEELLLRHAGLVRGCARGFFLIGGDTDDLTQEGMIGLYSAIVEYKQKEGMKFKTFASLCVSRRIIDAVRASSRKKHGPLNYVSFFDEDWIDSALNPEDLLIQHEDKREFRQKMSAVLSDFEFKITTMYMDGMTCAEICNATGKSAKSIDNAIQRSKKKLQQAWQK